MAGKKTATKRAGSATADKAKDSFFKGFVNYSLDRAEKAKVQAWMDSPNMVSNALMDVLQDGYTLKIRWSEKQNCFQASLYDPTVERESFGWTLVGRSTEPERALGRLLYVHCVWFDEVWPCGSEVDFDDEGW